MSLLGTRQVADRRADLAAIHIAKAELRWSDDEYRDILQTICNVRSSAELDVTGRKRWLAHLQACVRANRGAGAPAKPVRKPLTQPQRKMWALWMQLADAGLVNQRSMAALNAFAQRQTQVARIEWLNGHQEALVIESLKRWLSRREEPTA